MIDPIGFTEALARAGVRFATGVPDSLLKDVCACIAATLPPGHHVGATHEGSAVGLAIGHYLATGRPALVYLQNSGLGNVVNPVASLADPLVYGIPMLLMVGWRGELRADGTQVDDEPQHAKQGRVTVGQLDLLGIPHRTLDPGTVDVDAVVDEVVRCACVRGGPAALLVRRGTFASFALRREGGDARRPAREEAIGRLVEVIPAGTPVVATTGMASRELFELRRSRHESHDGDFLTVGGMGHASQIAAGIAMARPDRKVACIDGDGALLMHMGALAVGARCGNLVHVVINNGAHDSVGGQPTAAGDVDLAAIARDCGYGSATRAATLDALERALRAAFAGRGSAFVEVACRRGARADLGRPDRSPARNRDGFMRFLAEGDDGS